MLPCYLLSVIVFFNDNNFDTLDIKLYQLPVFAKSQTSMNRIHLPTSLFNSHRD